MKLHIFLLSLLFSTSAAADTVQKWTDEKGVVHYGDQKAAELVKKTETLEIKDTYDQQAYEEGMERHKETEEIANELEQERIKEEEEQRKTEEAEKSSSRQAPAGGIAGSPYRGRPLRERDNRPVPVNRPAQLPAKLN